MISISALEELASYVPALILRRMAVDSGATLTPDLERFPAAVLMADLSGFTALTERFARANPAGAEELTQILDRYFGRLVGVVIAHGGDVVKFAGDGLLALWYGAEPLAVLTQRAAQCGLAVQMMATDALGGFGSMLQPAELKMRVGVGAGETATMHVGGIFGRWELLIVGDPLRQAGLAEAQAQPGEALIAPEAWPLVADACNGVVLPSGHVRLAGLVSALPLRALALPPLLPPMADALRAYIPRAVLTRVDADQTAWIAEQRRVTVLFIHLPDLRADTPLRRAQALMRALQTSLYRYEGSISRLGADSKGPTLMAAFGLPPLAHEDDPLRALRAALDIQAALATLNFACSIGITTGQALCGAVGGTSRREYTTMGTVVNHAARFMQAALLQTPLGALPIVCDATTCNAAAGQVAFESLPPLRLKGVTDPVPAFRPGCAAEPDQPAPSVPHSAELIGRERELDLITLLIDRLSRNEAGAMMLLEGEAGIGKTSLINHARMRAAAAGIAVLYSAAQPIAGAPYTALRPIVLALLADGAEWPSPPTPADLAASSLLADPELQRLLPLLSAVLALELPDTPFTAQMSGPVRADNTRELLVHILIRAATRRPFVLALDDAQWLDAGSWALLRAVLARRLPIAFIVALRPIAVPPAEYQLIAYHTDSTRLTMRGLQRSALQRLIAQRLGSSQATPDVVDLIATRTRGNPLFSAELALALHESQLIQIRDATAMLTAQPRELERTLAALRLPETVHGLITSRIDRLSPPQQLTLKVASVIGPSFTLSDLAAIHPAILPVERLSEQLFQLQQAGLVALEAFEPEFLYTFQPAMVAEVAYNLMSFAQRRRLHQALAERLEPRIDPDVVLHYARLAHHWQAAGETIRARSSLGNAGEAALRTGAYREALGFFTGALRLAETAGVKLPTTTQASWERQLGEVYHNSGRLIESHELLTTATRRLGWPFPQGRRAVTRSLLRAIGIQVAHRLGLYRPYRLSNPAQRREAARAYTTIAQLAYYENQLLPALYAMLHSLNLAETIPPSPELATAYAGVQLAVGATPLARVYRRLAQRTAQALGHLPSLAWIAEVHALNAIGRADWRHARAAVAYGVTVAVQIGDQRRRAECLALAVLIDTQTGAHTQAVQAAARLYEFGLQNADVQVQTWGLVGQAENLLYLGDEARATVLLGQAETLITENFGHALAEELWVYGLMAWAALQRGDLRQARALATVALDLGGPLPPTAMYALGGYSATAEVALALLEQSTYTTPAEARQLRSLARRVCLMFGYLALLFPLVRPAAARAWRRLIAL
jgi:class 3 adenylate cyclase/tetratricopeptide (TPR) repeat protein